VRTWKELGTAFRELEGGRTDARLDYQWGAAGEHWRIAATMSRSYVQQFEALARIAGSKILEVPGLGSDPMLAAERDPTTRWFRALVRMSGRFEHGLSATQLDDEGKPAGNIYGGTLHGLSDAAANLCLTAEANCVSSTLQVDAISELARYKGPMSHWREARRRLTLEQPDTPGAVHEAVSAVEGMARLLLADDSITLGKAVDELRQAGLLHPALAKCFDGVWGYASAVPGIRHGASSPVVLADPEPAFVVGTCEAALRLLIALDLRQQSSPAV